MTTFFPHLYEYGKVLNFFKEFDKKNAEINPKRKRILSNGKHSEEQENAVISKISPDFNEYRQSKNIDFLVYLELKAQKLRESNYNPIKHLYATIEMILKERTELSNADKYMKPPEWPLNDEILTRKFEYPSERIGKNWAIVDFILCIEIAKTLPFFVQLSSSDQQEVLKDTTVLIASLTQAYYSFVASCDAIIFPDGSMPIKRPMVHSYQKDIFERIIEPVKRIKITKEEFVLLKTIIFCSSHSETISDYGRKMLESERERYSRLLLNHLQAKYGDAPGAVRYSQILSVMEAMTYFTQKAKEFYIFHGTMRPSFPHVLPLVDQILLKYIRMTTFFPHLYEYGRILNVIKECDQKNNNKKHQIHEINSTFDGYIKKSKTRALPKKLFSFEQCHQSRHIEFIIYLESKVQQLRESNYSFVRFNNYSVEKLLKERTELSKAENYKKPLEWPLDNETLVNQYNIISGEAVRFWFVIDAVLCIEMAKILPFFMKLNLNDQQNLLKENILQNILLTSAYYSAEAFYDVLYLPDGHMPSRYPKLHENQEDLFGRVVEPIKRIQMTKIEYVLIKTIIFCSSKSETISAEGRVILEAEFHRYSSLLLHHLQAKHGDAPGAVRYSQILSVMEAMTYFAQKSREYYVFTRSLKSLSSFPSLQLLDQIII